MRNTLVAALFVLSLAVSAQDPFCQQAKKYVIPQMAYEAKGDCGDLGGWGGCYIKTEIVASTNVVWGDYYGPCGLPAEVGKVSVVASTASRSNFESPFSAVNAYSYNSCHVQARDSDEYYYVGYTSGSVKAQVPCGAVSTHEAREAGGLILVGREVIREGCGSDPYVFLHTAPTKRKEAVCGPKRDDIPEKPPLPTECVGNGICHCNVGDICQKLP